MISYVNLWMESVLCHRAAATGWGLQKDWFKDFAVETMLMHLWKRWSKNTDLIDANWAKLNFSVVSHWCFSLLCTVSFNSSATQVAVTRSLHPTVEKGCVIVLHNEQNESLNLQTRPLLGAVPLPGKGVGIRTCQFWSCCGKGSSCCSRSGFLQFISQKGSTVEAAAALCQPSLWTLQMVQRSNLEVWLNSIWPTQPWPKKCNALQHNLRLRPFQEVSVAHEKHAILQKKWKDGMNRNMNRNMTMMNRLFSSKLLQTQSHTSVAWAQPTRARSSGVHKWLASDQLPCHLSCDVTNLGN